VELDWSTLLLEFVNFLILVWILKHFLYQPVLNVIEKRRQKIQQDLAEALARQQQAEALKQQYEDRLIDWEQEKHGALDALEQQLARQRSKAMQELDDELQRHRLQQQSRDRQQQEQWRSQAEARALQLSGAFAARLLQNLSGPELDLRLQQLFIEQLAALPEAALSEAREGWRRGNSRIEVISATTLDAQRQQTIRQALEQRLGPIEDRCQFNRDETLIAGLRVSIGGWTLLANLQDELAFFCEAAHGG
jgi:F-type H+-transporting ATPase subunit b